MLGHVYACSCMVMVREMPSARGCPACWRSYMCCTPTRMELFRHLSLRRKALLWTGCWLMAYKEEGGNLRTWVVGLILLQIVCVWSHNSEAAVWDWETCFCWLHNVQWWEVRLGQFPGANYEEQERLASSRGPHPRQCRNGRFPGEARGSWCLQWHCRSGRDSQRFWPHPSIHQGSK